MHDRVVVLLTWLAALMLSASSIAAEPPTSDQLAPVTVGDPFIFTAPSGRIIPSGVIYPRVGVDTSASFIGDVRLGLGDVVEFGVASTPYVRFERPMRSKAEYYDGYPLLFGRIGLNEGRLWSWQPGVVLGYRKSFEITHLQRNTQLSELSLALTKQFGTYVSVTLGVAKWGGAIEFAERDIDGAYELAEEKSYGERVRPFGGAEVRLWEGYRLMGEVYYMPEFEFAAAERQPNIELDAALAVGLRSELRPWLIVDVGARGPDIANLHQLDIEVFTQVIVPLRFLHDVIQ